MLVSVKLHRSLPCYPKILTSVQSYRQVRFNLLVWCSVAESNRLSSPLPLASLGLSSLPQCGYPWLSGALPLQEGVLFRRQGGWVLGIRGLVVSWLMVDSWMVRQGLGTRDQGNDNDK